MLSARTLNSSARSVFKNYLYFLQMFHEIFFCYRPWVADRLPAWTTFCPNIWLVRISLNLSQPARPRWSRLRASRTLARLCRLSRAEATSWSWRKLSDLFTTPSALFVASSKRGKISWVSIIFTELSLIPCFYSQLRFIIAGGGAPETELAYQLTQYAQGLAGVDAYCLRYFHSFPYLWTFK